MINWTELSKEIHQDCVDAGWWKPYPNKMDRYDTAMMLVISEIAEAMEGDRKNLMDDHLKQYRMFDVELADAAIRLLDSGGAYNISFNIKENELQVIKTSVCNKNTPEQLLYICRIAVDADINFAIHYAFAAIIVIAELHEIDLCALIQEKRAYNKVRADHKQEIRENSKYGKKY